MRFSDVSFTALTSQAWPLPSEFIDGRTAHPAEQHRNSEFPESGWVPACPPRLLPLKRPLLQRQVLTRCHTFALDHRYGVRRFQVVDECLPSCGFLGVRTER